MKTRNEIVLIVDDENLVRKLLASSLTSSGYACFEAGNAAEALQQLKNQDVSIALLDINMPGKSGIELLNEVMAGYPDTAVIACDEFKKGGYDFGILLCGTGIGMSITANKIKGIRCAQVHDLFTAEMAKAHNDANFIAFGGRVRYSVPVMKMIEIFMDTKFAGDRHARRVAKIMDVENK